MRGNNPLQKSLVPKHRQLMILLLGLITAGTGHATVLIGGNSFNNYPDYYVIGHTGNGTLQVDGGDTWNWTGNQYSTYWQSGVIMSRENGSSASGQITGAGSAVNVIGDGGPTFFQVGRGGTATLDITAGGSLNVIDPNAIPNTPPANAAVLVVGGSGSNFLPTNGTGTLTANNGHILIEGNRSVVNIGDGGGNGTLNISNGSSLQVIDHDPSSSSQATTKVGARTGSTGQLFIDNSTYSMTSDNGRARMSVGMDAGSLGFLQISNGGQLDISGATDGDLLIGFGRDHDSNPSTPNEGGTGIALVTGSGSSITTLDKVVVGSPLQLTGGGTSSGSLIVANGASITTGGGVYVGLGGFLGGDGTINSNLINDGGVIAMGNSPGTMTVNGDFTQLANSLMEVEINGNAPGQYDVLNVMGNLDITDGVIDMIFDPGFLAQLVNDVSLMPSLSQLLVSTGTWNVDPTVIQAQANGYQSVSLTFDPNGQLASVTANVPVPATLLLLGLGLLALATRHQHSI